MNLLGLFVGFPWLALVPALAFALLARQRRRRIAGVAAIAWLAYAGYETAMKLRILCTGECNIRVDLLLFYPVLLVLSIAALWARRAARPS